MAGRGVHRIEDLSGGVDVVDPMSRSLSLIDMDVASEDEEEVKAALTAMARRYSIVSTVKAFEDASVDRGFEVKQLAAIASGRKESTSTRLRALEMLRDIRVELGLTKSSSGGPSRTPGEGKNGGVTRADRKLMDRLGPGFLREADELDKEAAD